MESLKKENKEYVDVAVAIGDLQWTFSPGMSRAKTMKLLRADANEVPAAAEHLFYAIEFSCGGDTMSTKKAKIPLGSQQPVQEKSPFLWKRELEVKFKNEVFECRQSTVKKGSHVIKAALKLFAVHSADAKPLSTIDLPHVSVNISDILNGVIPTKGTECEVVPDSGWSLKWRAWRIVQDGDSTIAGDFVAPVFVRLTELSVSGEKFGMGSAKAEFTACPEGAKSLGKTRASQWLRYSNWTEDVEKSLPHLEALLQVSSAATTKIRLGVALIADPGHGATKKFVKKAKDGVLLDVSELFDVEGAAVADVKATCAVEVGKGITATFVAQRVDESSMSAEQAELADVASAAVTRFVDLQETVLGIEGADQLEEAIEEVVALAATRVTSSEEVAKAVERLNGMVSSTSAWAAALKGKLLTENSSPGHSLWSGTFTISPDHLFGKNLTKSSALGTSLASALHSAAPVLPIVGPLVALSAAIVSLVSEESDLKETIKEDIVPRLDGLFKGLCQNELILKLIRDTPAAPEIFERFQSVMGQMYHEVAVYENRGKFMRVLTASSTTEELKSLSEKLADARDDLHVIVQLHDTAERKSMEQKKDERFQRVEEGVQKLLEQRQRPAVDVEPNHQPQDLEAPLKEITELLRQLKENAVQRDDIDRLESAIANVHPDEVGPVPTPVPVTTPNDSLEEFASLRSEIASLRELLLAKHEDPSQPSADDNEEEENESVSDSDSNEEPGDLRGPAGALRSELSERYSKLYRNYTTVTGQTQLFSNRLYTTLRVSYTDEESLAEEKSAKFPAEEMYEKVLECSDGGFRVLLIEGRAGSGKTMMSIQLARLQVMKDGFSILVTLSNVQQRLLEERDNPSSTLPRDEQGHIVVRPQDLIQWSTENIDMNVMKLPAATIKEILAQELPIAWIVDGLDEVYGTADPAMKKFLHNFVTPGGRRDPQFGYSASGIVNDRDIVLVTSRAERDRTYSFEGDGAAQLFLLPWKMHDVERYVEQFFGEVGQHLQLTVHEMNAKQKMVEDAVKKGTLGRENSFLPIVCEMLCYIAMESNDASELAKTTLADLYQSTLDLLYTKAMTKNHSAPYIRPTEDDKDAVLIATQELANRIFTSREVRQQFQINDSDRDKRAKTMMLSTGYFRARFRFSGPTSKTFELQFTHKSFMEYFVARYFFNHIQEIETATKKKVILKSESEMKRVLAETANVNLPVHETFTTSTCREADATVVSVPALAIDERNTILLLAHMCLEDQSKRSRLIAFLLKQHDMLRDELRAAFSFQQRRGVETAKADLSRGKNMSPQLKHELQQGDGLSLRKIFTKYSGLPMLVELSTIVPSQEIISVLFKGKIHEFFSHTSANYFWMLLPCAQFDAIDVLQFWKGRMPQWHIDTLQKQGSFKEALSVALNCGSNKVVGFLQERFGCKLSLFDACAMGTDTDVISKLLIATTSGEELKRGAKAAIENREIDAFAAVAVFHGSLSVTDPRRNCQFTSHTVESIGVMFDKNLTSSVSIAKQLTALLLKHAILPNIQSFHPTQTQDGERITLYVDGEGVAVRNSIMSGLITSLLLKDLSCLKQLRFFDLHPSWLGEVTNASFGGIHDLAHLETLSLSGFEQLTDAAFEHLGLLTKLQCLSVAGCGNLTNEAFKDLDELEDLRMLDVSGCKKLARGPSTLRKLRVFKLSGCSSMTDDAFDIGQLQLLELLDVSGCTELTDKAFAHLGQLDQLQSLDVAGCRQLTDEAFKDLSNLKQLQSLHISGCKKLTTDAFRELMKLEDLRSFDASGCSGLSGDGLGFIGEMKMLQSLNVSGCSKLTFMSFKELQQLQTLDLSGCDALSVDSIARLATLESLNVSKCRQMTHASLCDVLSLNRLMFLDVSGCENLTDDAFKSIVNFKRLHTLDVSGCKDLKNAKFDCEELRSLKMAGCEYLKPFSLKNLALLETLDLSECHYLTDSIFDDLAQLKKLRSLIVPGCKFLTDNGFKDLGLLVQLQVLDVRGCHKLTNAAFQKLGDLRHLHTLNLSGCKQLTDLAAGEKARPVELRSLDISWCENITLKRLRKKFNLNRLQSLNVTGCKELMHGLKDISVFKELVSLNVSCTGFHSAPFEKLGCLTQLQALDVSRCKQLHDDALKDLGCLVELRSLDVTGCRNLTSVAFKDLGRLGKLQSLNFSGCEQLTDTVLNRCICEVEFLELLDVSGCTELTDKAFAHLGKLGHLQSLDVAGCWQLTGEAFKDLANLKQLRTLHVSGCKNLTRNAFNDPQQLASWDQSFLGAARRERVT